MDAEAIRRRLMERMRRGELRWPPNVTRIIARLGRSDGCEVCAEPIGPVEFEYVITTAEVELHVHRECFVLWMDQLT